MIKKNDFMNKIIVNNVYVNEKKIDFEIKFNDYKIYISNYLIKEKNNNENETYFKELNDFDGFKTKNDFNINNKLINDINVIAIEDDENNYYNNNIIGFEYRRNQENFLKQLYNKNIIENEIIFIDFYQNKIFFDYPKNISNIKYIKANIDGFLINFSINLDKIYTNVIKDSKLILNNNYSDFLENKYFEIEFNFNLNGIVHKKESLLKNEILFSISPKNFVKTIQNRFEEYKKIYSNNKQNSSNLVYKDYFFSPIYSQSNIGFSFYINNKNNIINIESLKTNFNSIIHKSFILDKLYIGINVPNYLAKNGNQKFNLNDSTILFSQNNLVNQSEINNEILSNSFNNKFNNNSLFSSQKKKYLIYPKNIIKIKKIFFILKLIINSIHN